MVSVDPDSARLIAREIVEIVHSAPIQRLVDDDGTEYVARDALIAEIRSHVLRRAAVSDVCGCCPDEAQYVCHNAYGDTRYYCHWHKKQCCRLIGES